MPPSDHELLASRLTAILQRLNEGERLNVDRLAEEFGVHRRTIQRDLLERFAFLPLDKKDGQFFIDPAYLGRLGYRDIQRFAEIAGVCGLFPRLDAAFLRELFDSRLSESFDVHGQSPEDLRHRAEDFRRLQQAIRDRYRIAFTYQKPEDEKIVEAAPYRLINHNGVWYLAATDDGQIKAYAFSKIRAINVREERFTPEAEIVRMLDQEDSIWLNEKKTEVVLTVAPPAALYFSRRKLIARQVIEKTLEDGGLIVSGKFAHPNQILPIVRYWLPHVRIVSPAAWQEMLEAEMKAYLNA